MDEHTQLFQKLGHERTTVKMDKHVPGLKHAIYKYHGGLNKFLIKWREKIKKINHA